MLDAGAHSRMKTNPTENLSAYSFYADALMAVDANNTKAAMAALEQAIKVDPGFCKALRLAVDLAAKAQDPRLNQWREQSENCKER